MKNENHLKPIPVDIHSMSFHHVVSPPEIHPSAARAPCGARSVPADPGANAPPRCAASNKWRRPGSAPRPPWPGPVWPGGWRFFVDFPWDFHGRFAAVHEISWKSSNMIKARNKDDDFIGFTADL